MRIVLAIGFFLIVWVMSFLWVAFSTDPDQKGHIEVRLIAPTLLALGVALIVLGL